MTSDREGAPLGEARPTSSATPRRPLRLWFVLAVLWAGATAYAGLQGWPTLPLDLPRHDPQIQVAFNRAVEAHVGRYVLLGLVPPLLVLIFGWLVARLARPRA